MSGGRTTGANVRSVGWRPAAMMAGPFAQMAAPSSDPSTTGAWPVRSRATSAAQIPLTSIMPAMPSPCPTIGVGVVAPDPSIADCASDPRHHHESMS